MNLLSGIHSKAKPVLLFLFVMLAVVGSSVVEKRLMRSMTTSISSLYQDRLVPATGLFQLNDLMYAKRQLLEKYLAAPAVARQRPTLARLAALNQQLQAIIKQHEATYLVADEKQLLRTFQARLARYNALEAQLLAQAVPSSAEAPGAAIAQQFALVHTDLSQLNQIQQRVGQQLSQRSLVTESTATLLSNLTIAVLVAFTLAIQYTLLSSRHPLVPKNLQNFRLN
ncbi:MCP four helix bundle domain-containing protein [Hymenobacter humi]|uniref:MCP four helix bundle domain-containing protein n=1 Tax=Hymenobacter humi TaxID=1411620 RepID=A0ABW2U411_9BACT